MVPTPTVLCAQMRPPDKPSVDLQIPGPRPAASFAMYDACQARSTSAVAISLPQLPRQARLSSIAIAVWRASSRARSVATRPSRSDVPKMVNVPWKTLFGETCGAQTGQRRLGHAPDAWRHVRELCWTATLEHVDGPYCSRSARLSLSLRACAPQARAGFARRQRARWRFAEGAAS